MKKILLTLTSVLFCAITFAQGPPPPPPGSGSTFIVPQGINYQAVARDANGDVLMNQALMIQLSVISDITNGTISWQELQAVTTNDFGLFTAVLGQGSVMSVGSSATFNDVDWGDSPHYLKVEIDYGTGYLDMGTTAFMSVPYALYSAAGSSTSTCGLSIGDTTQGGIIFYLDPSGCHGLVCALTDQSTGIHWYNGSFTNTTAFASCNGCGDGNTSMIVFNQGAGSYAAKLCYDLSLGGYTDWYLPSKYELNAMYLNLHQQGLGGFASYYYWSSTEYDDYFAWYQNFSNGYQFNDWFSKYANLTFVRAVRAF